ncbi:Asp-tRNA(Asn)/Glu-tRNA(Gln) amidotransferase GatCAB subunit A [Halobacillus massiliensis]|uniref:Asp-tRNA(Asn)/Glu-tRNA(Gln) amidotransferase GatCAB subunit A n=1 Tax=Halobacillus massiliensis TaxID=1926286 RepID=UPI0009E3FFCD|nr:Asp-tRNA(Asn)/Glu-tRNA(Gln) amidotransferase GatCAB subunit A [Halobacillus massiliensis]
MSKERLYSKTIDELSGLIRKKEVSPVEVTKATLERAKNLNDQVNAFISITEDHAIDMALLHEKEILNGNYRGKLHGIPMALKDIFFFEGEVATIGSKIHQDFIPSYESTVVSKLKEAGVVFTGKLNMHEYAWGATTANPHYGPCRNPWNLEKIPGGSSGGSGAAVIADMTIASLGTDTGGSIRIPASSCGIVGLKPTHGRVSKYGCFPLAWSLDHIGPMAKTVTDAAILLEAIAGFDSNDPTTVDVPTAAYTENLKKDISGMVIGVNEEYFFRNVDSEVEALVRAGIRKLENMGANVVHVDIPSLKNAEFAELITIMTEASTVHHSNLIERSQDFGEDVRLLLEAGEVPSAVDYLQAQQIRRQLDVEFAEAMKQVDVIISPTLPFTPIDIGADTLSLNSEIVSFLDHIIRFTLPGNLTGLPSISIPCGLSNGLPVGMQIMGKAFKEEDVLQVAYAFERTNPMNGLKPNLSESNLV